MVFCHTLSGFLYKHLPRIPHYENKLHHQVVVHIYQTDDCKFLSCIANQIRSHFGQFGIKPQTLRRGGQTDVAHLLPKNVSPWNGIQGSPSGIKPQTFPPVSLGTPQELTWQSLSRLQGTPSTAAPHTSVTELQTPEEQTLSLVHSLPFSILRPQIPLGGLSRSGGLGGRKGMSSKFSLSSKKNDGSENRNRQTADSHSCPFCSQKAKVQSALD